MFGPDPGWNERHAEALRVSKENPTARTRHGRRASARYLKIFHLALLRRAETPLAAVL